VKTQNHTTVARTKIPVGEKSQDGKSTGERAFAGRRGNEEDVPTATLP
jgi:hypothetical protein